MQGIEFSESNLLIIQLDNARLVITIFCMFKSHVQMTKELLPALVTNCEALLNVLLKIVYLQVVKLLQLS